MSLLGNHQKIAVQVVNPIAEIGLDQLHRLCKNPHSRYVRTLGNAQMMSDPEEIAEDNTL